jgi:hypothetical protein
MQMEGGEPESEETMRLPLTNVLETFFGMTKLVRRVGLE